MNNTSIPVAPVTTAKVFARRYDDFAVTTHEWDNKTQHHVNVTEYRPDNGRDHHHVTLHTRSSLDPFVAPSDVTTAVIFGATIVARVGNDLSVFLSPAEARALLVRLTSALDELDGKR